MKTATLIFLTLFLAKGCDKELQKEMETSTIEYMANTRGFYLNITIQDEKLFVIKQRDGKPKEFELSNADWKEIANLYQKIKIKEIPDYKAPTEKRFYDGAAIATLRIVQNGETFQSQAFDHGTPPVEIEAFVNKIVALVSTEE